MLTRLLFLAAPLTRSEVDGHPPRWSLLSGVPVFVSVLTCWQVDGLGLRSPQQSQQKVTVGTEGHWPPSHVGSTAGSILGAALKPGPELRLLTPSACGHSAVWDGCPHVPPRASCRSQGATQLASHPHPHPWYWSPASRGLPSLESWPWKACTEGPAEGFGAASPVQTGSPHLPSPGSRAELVLARFPASQGCGPSPLSPSPGLVLSLGWTVSPAVNRCLLCCEGGGTLTTSSCWERRVRSCPFCCQSHLLPSLLNLLAGPETQLLCSVEGSRVRCCSLFPCLAVVQSASESSVWTRAGSIPGLIWAQTSREESATSVRGSVGCFSAHFALGFCWSLHRVCKTASSTKHVTSTWLII